MWSNTTPGFLAQGFCLTGVVTKAYNLNDLLYIPAKDIEGPCNVHFDQKGPQYHNVKKQY